MSTGIGATLRTEREEQGLLLSDVAEETAISRRRLAALEEERFDALGGDVYVRSSLRLYAGFLGIDADPLVAAYAAEHSEPVDTPVLPDTGVRQRVSPVVTFGIVALVVVVGLAVIGSYEDTPTGDSVAVATEEAETGVPGPDPVPSATAPPTDGTGQTAAPSEPAAAGTPPADTGPVPLAEADEVRAALNVSGGASWVRITVDSEEILEETVGDGFSETFTGNEIEMRIGNAGAAEVVVNGETLTGFEPGEVVDVSCAAGADSCTVE